MVKKKRSEGEQEGSGRRSMCVGEGPGQRGKRLEGKLVQVSEKWLTVRPGSPHVVFTLSC